MADHRFLQRRRQVLQHAALAATGLIGHGAYARGAGAEPFPRRPVTIVVPGPAGGSGDIVARLLARELGDAWSQSVVVDNRPGAGGIIGVQAALAAPRDGHTLLMGNTGPNAINYSLYARLPYGPADLQPLNNVLAFPNVLIVRPGAPWKSVEELVAEGRRSERGLSFASSGIGQTTHLSGELFKLRTGIRATHVPYKGANLGLQSVIAGETDFMFDNFPTSESHLKGGTVRGLALTSARRITQAPELPTMAEAGFPDMEITGWFALFAPAGVPAARTAAVVDTLDTILRTPAFADRLRQLGGQSGVSTPAEFAGFVERERVKWARAVEASGARENF
ncbi:tripartite tricarboxylate transporter substrate binding protein [Xylophilus sp. GOD-11R]|uniref:Bug family tripartite tricarboxylate transporter substrate binding protein n=1 Tax=Xylophilus sp. GOD-11R TaxID=3089814 RepID=UPI00298CCB59|nr:tripartite tricarboxylate transporter substrate binding protein [Xylophilus sp. GOD-11R]WPB58368.1 tripartite tricarboxylate transporter substrate binding protein [Xylophilus sp. GOD-11R]